jgi:hypothetical protein
MNGVTMKGLFNQSHKEGNQVAQKIFIAVVLILLLVVPGISVSGVSTTLNETYCASQLKGTWSGNTCTIPVGIERRDTGG